VIEAFICGVIGGCIILTTCSAVFTAISSYYILRHLYDVNILVERIWKGIKPS
jgi:hypothetical protein